MLTGNPSERLRTRPVALPGGLLENGIATLCEILKGRIFAGEVLRGGAE